MSSISADRPSPANIGLQRTSRRSRAAAEAGSFGVGIKGVTLLFLAMIGITHIAGAQDRCDLNCVAIVSISCGMCLDDPGPTITLLPDGSGDLLVPGNAPGFVLSRKAERYPVAWDDPDMNVLFRTVLDLDPSLGINTIPDAGGVTIRCNPPGSLFVMRRVGPADKTPVKEIRDSLQRILYHARLREQWGFVALDVR